MASNKTVTGKRTTGPKRVRAADALKVLYIHGIGDHPAGDEEKRVWDLALFGRDMSTDTAMAYWADLRGAAQPVSTKRTRATGDAINAEAILAEVGIDVQKNAKARAFAAQMDRAYGMSGEGTAAKALPLPGFLRKPLARAVIKAFIKDVALYLFDPKKKAAIQERFLRALPADGSLPTVVAHSLGSVIALEALAKRTAPRVGTLVTIGSPLGIQEVQDFLECGLKVPACVENWHNFADPFDLVALDKGLANEFENGHHIVDTTVLNTQFWHLGGFNPHSAAGYLAHPKVRTAVCDGARLDRHARFLMARDVAMNLGIGHRHPVLIEILEPGYPAVAENLDDLHKRENEERVEADRHSRDQAAAGPLARRIDAAASQLEVLVTSCVAGSRREREQVLNDARIERLRRFVSARLTPSELLAVADQHRELRVYAIWKSAAKRKLIHRSRKVIHVDAAQVSYGASGDGIRWAVLDTGINAGHPHFEANEVELWDCTSRGKPRRLTGDPDRDGHGTHVSGIIAGASEDGRHQGMAPRAKLAVYKVLDDSGAGEDAWIIKALDHIAERNENSSGLEIHGLNLSLGGPYDSTVYGCGFSPICAELRRLWRSGVLVVVASGNEGQVSLNTPDGGVDLNSPMSIGDPANLEECIAVGSVNADQPHLYGISAFSSRGPTSDGRCKPDVVAPGERIDSCNSHYKVGTRAQPYRVESGTSMAAPHVSGLLAAFLSARREFRGRPDEVKELLLRTCTDIGRDRHHQGHGIPNLMRMLLEA